MTQREYEYQKRLLDEQLQAGIALLEAAHRQQRRALDLVWMTMAEGDVAPGLAFPALLAATPAREGEFSRPAEKRVRRPPGELQAEVEAALERLPGSFDRNDLLALLDGSRIAVRSSGCFRRWRMPDAFGSRFAGRADLRRVTANPRRRTRRRRSEARGDYGCRGLSSRSAGKSGNGGRCR